MFVELSTGYLKWAWQADPVRTTRSGMRGYDHLLPDVTPEGLKAARAEVERLLAACAAVDPKALTADQVLDLKAMTCDLQDALLGHEAAEWTRNPAWYVETIADGVNLILEGDWAGDKDRASDLIARLQGGTAMLQQAKEQLEPERVPPLWVEMARQGVAGTLLTLTSGIPRFVEAAGAKAGAVEAAAAGLGTALQDFAGYLEGLAARAGGSYAVGEAMFTAILQKRHLVNMTADELYDWGAEQVRRYEAELLEAARAIDPNRSWTEIMDEIRGDYPPAEKWLEAFQENMATARQHLIDHDLISIPEGESCRMVWTPLHMRATHPLGGMFMTAPYTTDLESRFFVTPNDESAPRERQLEHHRDLNHSFLRSIALHEVYPGHHLQGVHAKQGQSTVRRWQHATTLVEGWGLYTETLMHETGYLNDPRVHLMYVKNSLWRAVRVVVDVGLHARGMSFEEAVGLMQDKLRMETHMAAGEVRRYTMSPTYQSSYLLGRTAILALRDDYAAKVGASFTLKEFHDRLLRYGSIPMALIREAML